MKKWVKIANVFGVDAMPADAAIVISAALEQAIREGHVNCHNKWQFIEYLCADYLAGGRINEDRNV